MRFSPDGKYFYVNGIGFPLSHHLVLTAIFLAGRALQQLRAESSTSSTSRSTKHLDNEMLSLPCACSPDLEAQTLASTSDAREPP
ncbi:hypothetical protein RLW55_09975 [Hyphomicrobium sp. B1]|uniref:hypothetical protein n=1 Tax=Hyphomicrobium sp. B1 TaxID=3075651 RepID=UPI003C2C20F8